MYKASRFGPVIPEQVAHPKFRQLALIGEGPGEVEEEQNQFFVGPSGECLNGLLEAFRLDRADWHITNVMLCRSEKPIPLTDAAEACRFRLESELSRAHCTHYVTLGAQALATVCRKPPHIHQWCGGLLPALGGMTAVPTFHPAFVLRPEGAAYTPVAAIHIARAAALADGTLAPWRWPKAIIEPDKKALAALAKMATSNEPIAIDTETRGTDPMHVPMMAIGLATTRLAVSLPWDGYAPFGTEWVASLDLAHRSAIRALLHTKRLWVFQNAQHDLLALERAGLGLPSGEIFDLLVAHAVAAPGIAHDLGMIACIDLHAERWKTIFRAGAGAAKGAEKYAKRRPLDLRAYNAKDALATALLLNPIRTRLEQTHLGQKFYEGHMKRAAIALKMRKHGMAVSEEARNQHGKSLRRRLQRTDLELRQLAETAGLKTYNPDAASSTHKLFFGKFHVRPTKWSEKTGTPTLDAEVLTELLKSPVAIVSLTARRQLEHRRWRKLLVDYIENLPVAAGRVHPGWNPVGARTQRWACGAPNLMNIPKPRRDDRGRAIPGLRDLFKASRGKWLVAADYDQLEMRLIAMCSQDERLLAIFHEGRDVHVETARALLSKHDISKSERDLVKPLNYGAGYGAEPDELHAAAVIDFPDVTLAQMQRFHALWFETYRGVAEWQARELRRARELRHIENPLSGHRMQFFRKVKSTEVYNWPIQGAAAYLINEAILTVSRELQWGREAILAQVHDELLLEGGNAKRLTGILRDAMTVEKMEMRFTVSVKRGRNWGAMEKVL